MKILLALLILLQLVPAKLFADSANYCAAIRGNGELAPAHWTALARIIEHKGIPSKVAGGSSAAISLFLLDAVSRNKFANTHNEQALLMKSFVPHILFLMNEDAKSAKIMKIMSDFSSKEKGAFFKKVRGALRVATNLRMLLGILGDYGRLLNPKLIHGLKTNFAFHKAQALESLKMLGAFDAMGDENIFFREGVVDFRQLGIIFGRMADFAAGYANSKTNRKLNFFLKQCSGQSKGKTWEQLAAADPQCPRLLNLALKKYYRPNKRSKKRRRFSNRMIFERVGSGLISYPTTAIVKGAAAKRYEDLKRAYIENEAKGFEQFSLDYDTELQYAYWGDKRGLDRIENGLKKLYPKDLKSSKFAKLLNGSWFEVLATSPAEPGLANLQKIPLSSSFQKKKMLRRGLLRRWINTKRPKRSLYQNRRDIYSIGGWSDLHPTLVLRAAGCDDVIYITRQGGDSVFGQQIFIRLTGYSEKISFWREIKDHNRIGFKDLSYDEQESPWNKLYNLANPASSLNLSIKEASAIYCTDWDAFYIFKGEARSATHDSYNAPLFLKDESQRAQYNFGLDFENKSSDGFPGCLISPDFE